MKLDRIEYKDRDNNIHIENVPGEGFLKFLYNKPFGKLPLEALVKRKFLSEVYGRYMSSSLSKKKIDGFVKENNINMDEALNSIENYSNFNNFFFRKLKTGARKIEENFVSPADGKIIVFENVNEWDKFFIKGRDFSLKEFISDETLYEKYKDGSMAIVRLAPADYHRFHFPVEGIPRESKKIDGFYYSVSPFAIKDNFKIFCDNKREHTLFETKEYGDILISEVGATMVGGIIQTYAPNNEMKKGDEKGYFAFGGSTVVLLFEKDKIKFDKDLIKNTNEQFETKIKVGEKIGEVF